MSKATVMERIGFEASVALDKTPALIRGWDVGNDPDTQEAIKLHNESQYNRAKIALLATLKV